MHGAASETQQRDMLQTVISLQRSQPHAEISIVEARLNSEIFEQNIE